MELLEIVLALVIGIPLLLLAASVFLEDLGELAGQLLRWLLWLPVAVTIGGAVAYLGGEREIFTPLFTVLYLVCAVATVGFVLWLASELFD